MALVALLEDLILSAITGAGTGLAGGLIGGDIPACDWDAGTNNADNFWVRSYTEDEDGNQKAVADICWTAGGYHLGDQDMYVAECLADLHVQQAFTCIERVGSSCDGPESDNTAIATMRVRYSLSGDGDQQIDDYNRNKMVASIRKLKDEKKDEGFDLNAYINVAPRYDEGDVTYWHGIYYGTGSASNGC